MYYRVINGQISTFLAKKGKNHIFRARDKTLWVEISIPSFLWLPKYLEQVSIFRQNINLLSFSKKEKKFFKFNKAYLALHFSP